ncbi:MAG: EamA family transporter [Steroidobacteraceae bacterium]
MNLAALAFLLLGVLLNAGAQLGLKAATARTGPIGAGGASLWDSALQLATVPAFWAAIGAYGLSLVVWIVGLSRVPVSQAYPLLSLGYVVTAVLAWALLGEALSAMRLVGIAVIIVGVVLVSRS